MGPLLTGDIMSRPFWQAAVVAPRLRAKRKKGSKRGSVLTFTRHCATSFTMSRKLNTAFDIYSQWHYSLRITKISSTHGWKLEEQVATLNAQKSRPDSCVSWLFILRPLFFIFWFRLFKISVREPLIFFLDHTGLVVYLPRPWVIRGIQQMHRWSSSFSAVKTKFQLNDSWSNRHWTSTAFLPGFKELHHSVLYRTVRCLVRWFELAKSYLSNDK